MTDRTAQRAPDAPLPTPPHLVTEIPGPKAREHVAFDERWTSPSLTRAYPFVPVRGQGSAVEDIDGNVFLDFSAGIAVNSTGHAHPRVIDAIRRQAERLLHFSSGTSAHIGARRLTAGFPSGPRRRAGSRWLTNGASSAAASERGWCCTCA